ncbi:hypothetical protein [Flocculibacter collagenilyticus]|uniref:hypothetical protein n=1 Tax=Flocculibacter collagenilyticus TaxID=2744479 RepID=UPI0018F34629|nr:hypothetical protein [Flocculibacter collagenilyticus]
MDSDKILKKLGVLGKVLSGGSFIYKQFIGNKKDANAVYIKLYPVMRSTLQNYGWDAEQSQGVLQTLANLPPTGAKRRNFVRRYITPRDGWKKLPKDPNDIPFGFWH